MINSTGVTAGSCCKNRVRLPVLVGCALLCSALPALAAGVCPRAPEPVRTITAERYYSDRAGSQIDAQAQARLRQQVAPLKHYLTRLARMSDEVWTVTDRHARVEAAGCAAAWLAAWARADALLGKMSSRQAHYERKWSMTGLGLIYLKVRPYTPMAEQRVIGPWLRRLAERSDAVLSAPARKRNNHRYWLGLGLAAVGLATQDDALWDKARSIMHEAARAIGPEGLLPLELERKSKALHYHAFASIAQIILLTPLIVLIALFPQIVTTLPNAFYGVAS